MLGLCVGLAVLTFAIFAPALQFDFVNYDDLEYVVENPHVATGLSAANVRWAFENAYTGTGGPLTWMSHMADVEMFGLDAGAHHRTSIVLHALNATLLFGVLFAMTRAIWPSAWVAAMFAIHPLHVESVAWVAERKDVLSTSFWLLTTASYVFYARRPSVRRYAATFALMTLGLLSKPMVATLPFVLLLLDVWPLARTASAGALVLEKVPLMALSAASIGLTFSAQQRIGAVAATNTLPMASRLSNAVVSYADYIRKTVWPANLSAFYPYRLSISPALIAGCCLGLLAISLLAILVVRRAPYVTVGWLWFAGTLVPVIGIVQLGSHAMADRFTYVPLIGLFIVVAWGGAEVMRRAPALRAPLTGAAVVAIAACAFVARQQVLHWQNGVALWTHAARVTSSNARAHANLGVALARSGRRTEAVAEYTEALRIEPGYAEAHNNLGLALAQEQPDAALAHFQDAVRLDASYANAQINLANLLDERGRSAEAIEHYRAAISVQPDNVLARLNLAIALARAARLDDAISELEAVLRLEPANVPAKTMLEEMRRDRRRQ